MAVRVKPPRSILAAGCVHECLDTVQLGRKGGDVRAPCDPYLVVEARYTEGNDDQEGDTGHAAAAGRLVVARHLHEHGGHEDEGRWPEDEGMKSQKKSKNVTEQSQTSAYCEYFTRVT